MRRLGNFSWSSSSWLLLLGFFQALVWGWGFAVDDLDASYAFLGGDGRDWISNALAWSGEEVRFSARPPAFPLFLALLLKLGVAGAWPFFAGLVVTALAFTAFRFGEREGGPAVGWALGLYVLLSAPLARLGVEVMADLLCATFMLAAIWLFARAAERPERYRLVGLVAALATLTQQVMLLLAVAALAVVWLRRPKHLRRRELWQGAACFVAPVLLWGVIKWVWVSTPGDYLVRNWSLVSFHTDAISFYGHAALGLFGWPALVLLVWVLARSRRRGLSDSLLLSGLGLAGWLLFFVLLYDWPSRRFLVYPLVVALPWLARGLASLRAPTRSLAAACLIVFAAWPAAPGGETGWWVAPGFAVVGPSAPLPAGSGLGEEVAREQQSLRRQRVGWREAWEGSLTAEAWRRWRGREADATIRLDRTWAEGAASVVFLSRPEDDRYFAIGRLGNALRRRVKVVPAGAFPADWWGWICLEAERRAEGFVVARWRCPGSEQLTPLVLLAWRGEVMPRLSPPGGPPPALPAEFRSAWERARALAAAVSSPDGFLVVATGPEPAEWHRALGFVAGTSSLFLLAGEAPLELGGELNRRELAGCEVVTRRYLGYRLEVVEACGPN